MSATPHVPQPHPVTKHTVGVVLGLLFGVCYLRNFAGRGREPYPRMRVWFACSAAWWMGVVVVVVS